MTVTPALAGPGEVRRPSWAAYGSFSALGFASMGLVYLVDAATSHWAGIDTAGSDLLPFEVVALVVGYVSILLWLERRRELSSGLAILGFLLGLLGLVLGQVGVFAFGGRE